MKNFRRLSLFLTVCLLVLLAATIFSACSPAGKDSTRSLSGVSFSEITAGEEVFKNANKQPDVIPALKDWFGRTGNFNFSKSGKIIVSDDAFEALQAPLTVFVSDLKTLTGFEYFVTSGNGSDVPAGSIYVSLSTQPEKKGLGEEGYILDINSHLTIVGASETAVIWATKTILQIAKQNADFALPKGLTRDMPAYSVRGFMLDVGRRPFPLSALYDVVKAMSWYKMNDFHVHLNDNYIWLSDHANPYDAYSGFRLESDITGLSSTDLSYTKADFNKFILDASLLYGVTVVPEIDTPAHSLALTKVRPDLALSGYEDHLDLSNPESLAFVKQIWDEYLDGESPVLSTPVVHIGTDEYSEEFTEEFRKYTDDMLRFIRDEKGLTPRFWASLTARSGATPVTAKGVQANIWSTDWGKPVEMMELGYDIINTLDTRLYIVPGADYYQDWLKTSYVYQKWSPNVFNSTVIDAENPQLLGGTFALWNDLIDLKDNGLSDKAILERAARVFPVISEKLWDSGMTKSYAEHQKLIKKIASAPNAGLFEDMSLIEDRLAGFYVAAAFGGLSFVAFVVVFFAVFRAAKNASFKKT